MSSSAHGSSTPSRNSSASYTHEKRPRTLSGANTAISEESHQREVEDDTLSNHEEPPPLNYTVRIPRRERYIAVFFTLLFVETGILPLILFYSLAWGAHLSNTKNLAIITSLVGTVSGLKVTQRTWQLWFKTGHESRRPIGAGRWGVDTTQYVTSRFAHCFAPLTRISSTPVFSLAVPWLRSSSRLSSVHPCTSCLLLHTARD